MYYSNKFVNLLFAGWSLSVALLLGVYLTSSWEEKRILSYWVDRAERENKRADTAVADLQKERSNHSLELREQRSKAQDKLEAVNTSKFEDQMKAEEALQKERLKTFAANERHGETLERVRKAAAAKMSPEAFENFIFSYSDKEVKVDPIINLYRSLDQDKWGEILKKHYSTK
jgi:hypothetical protein